VIPALVMPMVVTQYRWIKFAMMACIAMTLAILLETFLHPHYAAPALPLTVVLFVQCQRYLRTWRWRGRPMGRSLARVVVIAFVPSYIMCCFQFSRPSWAMENWASARRHAIETVRKQSGRHLIMVRYGPEYSGDFRMGL
jgi:hypothetical protein